MTLDHASLVATAIADIGSKAPLRRNGFMSVERCNLASDVRLRHVRH